jgi:L-amino acid N-acyltransferase YncA
MIRLARPSDGEAFAAIYAPFVTESATSFEMEPPSTSEMAARIEAGLAYAPWLAEVAADGALSGFAYASKHRDRAAYRWSVDTSIYLHERARRQGIGRRLYSVLFALLRVQGFHAAHAGISLPNPASVALHEAMGFVPVGVYRAVGYKLGAWHDVGWWQLELRARVGAPAPPLTFAEAQARPEWADIFSRGAPSGS